MAETYVSDFQVLSDLTVRKDAKRLEDENGFNLNHFEDILNEYNKYNVNINIQKINDKSIELIRFLHRLSGTYKQRIIIEF